MTKRIFRRRLRGLKRRRGFDPAQGKRAFRRGSLRAGPSNKKEADKYDTPLIIDDRVDVAKRLGVGVHLGDDDMTVKEARAILGENALIGASVKTVERAKEAEAEGASYFGTGALFPTQTKVITRHTSMDTFRAIKKCARVPVYAIGGINEKTLPELKGEEFDGICVVSAIQYAENPEAAVKSLRAQMKDL